MNRILAKANKEKSIGRTVFSRCLCQCDKDSFAYTSKLGYQNNNIICSGIVLLIVIHDFNIIY